MAFINNNEVLFSPVASSAYKDGYNVGVVDGKKSAYDEFWDEYQNEGKRTYYTYAFAGTGWNDKTFKPKYNLRLYSAATLFSYAEITDLEKAMTECGVTFEYGEGLVLKSIVAHSKITVFPEIDTRSCAISGGLNYIFSYASELTTIRKLILRDDGKQTFDAPFFNCYALKNLTIEGVIGQNGFNVGTATSLTKTSLLSILNALKDYSADTSGKSWVVSLGKTNLNKLTATEKAIATDKGWTLA